MPVYVELVSNSKILNSVAGSKSVVILACTGCANPSIAYQKDLPCEKMVVKERMDTRAPAHAKRLPFAVVKEATRIRNLLESKGTKTKVVLWEWPCSMSSEAVAQLTDSSFSDEELVRMCTNADAIITLTCIEGTLGVRKTLGKSSKIVPGMKTVGRAFFYITLDESKQFTVIDRGKSLIVPSRKDV